MITFGDLYVEGFGSIVKPLVFKLDQRGLNVIRGRVGSGKTTIPSSLCWVLFGKTLKNKSSVETWEELRGDKFRGTKVSVPIFKNEEQYIITRCSKFKGKIKIGDKKVTGSNKIFIFRNGELITSFKNKNEQQEYITNLIGYSFELFKSAIIFGQKLKRIIEESGPDKKKIFEEAFKVNFIEEAKENVKVEKDKLEDAYSDISIKIDRLVDKLHNSQENYKNALDNEKKFDKIKKERIGEINTDLTELLDEEIEKKKVAKKKTKDSRHYEKVIKGLEKELDKIKDKERENKTRKEEISGLEEDIQEAREEIQHLKKDKPIDCPHCGQPMGKKERKINLTKKKEELKALKKEHLKVRSSMIVIDKYQKNNLETKLKKEREAINNISSRNSKIDDAKKKLIKIREKITKLREKKDKLEKSKLKIKSTKYKKKIKRLEKKITTQKVDLKRIGEEVKLKEWLIKDPLSNNGLKAYLFDSLMYSVNKALNEYVDIMGFSVEFGIDLDSHRKDFYQVIMQDGIIIPYEDLSGGQKQLVDTTVAFAIHDVISKLRPTNILFLDEPFESLGVEEIEIIEELVEKKAKDKCLFLITHQQSFNPRNVNEIVVKRGKNKVSKISLR